ncbi:unnamed protein product [Mycena citricolor]|uniref:Glucanase n=1 Tax=Mycena citricolor TaxID=2018698 RepID=A0AAD2HXD8_9AGAR|nr:unnamed protein product [Mycena citricolor]
MFPTTALFALCLAAVSQAQQIGTLQSEVHPTLTTQQCTAGGSCTTSQNAVVLDSNWRWTHSTSSATNCYTGNTWNAALCPDATTCAQNCALDGANYQGTYGVSTSGNALTLKFLTGSNVGSRVYLMADNTHYEMFQLLNQEFTFTVDASQLGCGLNGALYLTEMDADGGVSRFPNNKAGAQYGTGYCDAQCPQDLKFINGLANSANWTPSTNDPNTGTGTMGTCCNEMDIWEANKWDTAYTPHSCSVVGQTMCTGTNCGAGSDRYKALCDKDGCDFNTYRWGDSSFFGPGLTIDTTQPVTVVTQFLTNDNTTTGTLSEIRRLYVQGGKVFQNAPAKTPGLTQFNSVTDAFCNAQKNITGDTNSFEARGGLATMSAALKRGMVLALSLWDDDTAGMLWLDAAYPTNSSASAPGVTRGPCTATSGDPKTVQAQQPNAQVIFSNIKTGPIGSTFSGTTTGGGSGTTTSATTHSTSTVSSATTSSGSSSTGGTIPKFGQCGGQGWTGSGTCASGSTCVFSNPCASFTLPRLLLLTCFSSLLSVPVNDSGT